MASGTFAVDYLNEYTTFNNAPLTNDNDGDVLTYNGWTYTYDAQNRLTNANSAGATASFYYDGLNRQVARSINGIITFSVWDGDWAIFDSQSHRPASLDSLAVRSEPPAVKLAPSQRLEEYGPNNTLTQKYLQGYHGLVKTMVGTATYYYQDELGSTSHVASSSGALLEYYRYDLYGKPNVYDPGGNPQPSATPIAKDLGDGGARWINELGLGRRSWGQISRFKIEEKEWGRI